MAAKKYIAMMEEDKKKVLDKAFRLKQQVEQQDQVIGTLNELSTLLIFKLADMVNIALEEGTYYKK